VKENVMDHLGLHRLQRRRGAIQNLGLAAALVLVSAAAAGGGCGGGGDTASTSTGTSASHTSSSDTVSATGTGGSGGSGGAGGTTSSVTSSVTVTASVTSTVTSSASGTGGTGGGMPLCATAAKGSTRGSAIAVSPDDTRIVSVNRDVGSVTVMSVDYTDGQPKMTVVSEIAVGGEPWQVAIDGCGQTAYVVLRKDQKVVRIDNIDTNPVKGPSVDVGSEPTAIAITPNNTKIYVANWVEGTLSIIDPAAMKITGSVDLNSTLVATNALGPVTARPALAHPRSLAITNNGDTSDDDETVYATEWYASRTGPEDATMTKSDTNWQGLLYRVKVMNGAADTIPLPAVADTGFKDSKGQATGCFPNQVGSVTIEGAFAYVTSTCASPVGPLGAFQKGVCTTNANCAAINVASVCTAGLCTLSCAQDSDCGFGSPAGTCTLPAGTCGVIPTNFKTTTHPAVSVVDLTAGKATTTVLDQLFQTKAGANAFRVPLLPTDVGFTNGFGYVTGEGTDAVFRLVITAGAITDVGSMANLFIDLRKDTNDKLIRLPIGIANAHGSAFAFVNDDGGRDVTALALGSQAIAGNAAAMDFRITQSSALPVMGSPEDLALRGKRFFNTGLGRWSLKGAGWGSCGACHIDGLSDNITWYFNRGPRQTVSLEGSFASGDPTDQRIFNWTAIFDEVADFEGNIRTVSGGVGALVSTTSNPLSNADRINTAAEMPQQQGLQGSSDEIANPMGVAPHPHTIIADWQNITSWIKTIRSPRKPVGLVQADVDAGKALFSGVGQANCVGCHSGAKWTISTRFYTPDDNFNDSSFAPSSPKSLSTTSWATKAMMAGFPAALLPAANPAMNGFMRFGLPPGAEQLQCILRPVGTIKPPVAPGTIPVGVSDPAVNVLELRQDMVTGGQGIAPTGLGFNPPSLLGMSVGAPYFHAGNARTLEEVFANMFQAHHQSAIASVFPANAMQVKQLVAYLLSIDESEPAFMIPALGNTGGDFCAHN
jgi:YVTN family beta-propeller protein